jgi:hypothetical protein
LVEIIVQINRISRSNHDLMSCLLVNRHWSASTAPIIYGNIALMNSSLGSIAEQMNSAKYGSYIRSLTISPQLCMSSSIWTASFRRMRRSLPLWQGTETTTTSLFGKATFARTWLPESLGPFPQQCLDVGNDPGVLAQSIAKRR